MSNATAPRPYHQGDLREKCLAAARELLGDDVSALSLRSIARAVGVSPNAPYRHFQDKDDLLAALAAEGYRELLGQLRAVPTDGELREGLIGMGQAYVRFAQEQGPLFRLMLDYPCCGSHPETTSGAGDVTAYMTARLDGAVPEAEAPAFQLSVWALVHGLASLVRDGQLVANNPAELDELVSAAISASLNTTI
ncbi:TetR/AcrR family transcriptional regulator [Mycobacteriaceae bacterium NPDC060252]